MIHEVLVKFALILQYVLVQALDLHQLADELLQVAEVVLEKDQVAELACQSLAHVHIGQLGVLIESRVVNWIADGLLVVQRCNELSSR